MSADICINVTQCKLFIRTRQNCLHDELNVWVWRLSITGTANRICPISTVAQSIIHQWQWFRWQDRLIPAQIMWTAAHRTGDRHTKLTIFTDWTCRARVFDTATKYSSLNHGRQKVVKSEQARRSEAQRAKAWVEFLGRGQLAPSLPARRSVCKLLGGVRGKAPAEVDFYLFLFPIESIYTVLQKNTTLFFSWIIQSKMNRFK